MALKIGEVALAIMGAVLVVGVALAIMGAVLVVGGIKVFNLCIIQAISWGLL